MDMYRVKVLVIPAERRRCKGEEGREEKKRQRERIRLERKAKSPRLGWEAWPDSPREKAVWGKHRSINHRATRMIEIKLNRCDAVNCCSVFQDS